MKSKYDLARPSVYYEKWEEYYGRSFGSKALKRACWRKLLSYMRDGMEIYSNPEVFATLEAIAREKVNDPRSKFYITG